MTAKRSAKESLTSSLADALVFALVCGAVAAAIGIGALFLTSEPPFGWVQAGVLAGLVVGGGVMLLSVLIIVPKGLSAIAKERAQAKREAKRDAAARERQAAAAKEQAQREQERLLLEQKRCLVQLTGLPGAAVAHFRSSAEWAESAVVYVQRAQKHFADSKFSPFWEAIEATYVCLANFRGDVARLAACAEQYADYLEELDIELLDRSGVTVRLERFPDDLGLDQLREEAGVVEREAQAVVDRAQSDYHFASIYEQRRTTAAVIEGFESLSAAVSGMSAALSSSLDDVARRTEMSSARTNALLEEANAPSFRPETNNSELRSINQRLGEVVRTLQS